MMKTVLNIRSATHRDVSTIVQMLSDDILGEKRERFEDPLPESYLNAFHAINKDPNNELVVAALVKLAAGCPESIFFAKLDFNTHLS